MVIATIRTDNLIDGGSNSRRDLSATTLTDASSSTGEVYDILIRFNGNAIGEKERSKTTTTTSTISTRQQQGSTFISEPTPQQCLISILISDENGDGSMDTSEYFSFVNRLSRQTWANAAGGFDGLPQSMRDNFFVVSVNSPTINVFGARPGEAASTAQTDNLMGLCDSVIVTANEIFSNWEDNSDGVNNAPIGAAPTPFPTPVPAPVNPGTYQVCYDHMVESDADRNKHLDSDEYVVFCNLVSNGQLDVTSFGGLGTALQNRYFDLESASDGGGLDGIPIEGARLGSDPPRSEQMDFLERMCLDVGRTVEFVLNSSPPTPIPTLSPATIATVRPTGAPTPNPTTNPPTENPTPAPVVTGAPTTARPTGVPTVLIPPSGQPTVFSTLENNIPSVSSSPSLVQPPSSPPAVEVLGADGNRNTLGNNENSVLIASMVGGFVLLAGILCLVGGYLCWRSKRKDDEDEQKRRMTLSDDDDVDINRPLHLYDDEESAAVGARSNSSYHQQQQQPGSISNSRRSRRSTTKSTSVGVGGADEAEEEPSRVGQYNFNAGRRRGSNVVIASTHSTTNNTRMSDRMDLSEASSFSSISDRR
mmetsp:Transcript_21420/g.30798  ORF Transcript_21420/g.30798 Transcript_21420/m.30798 type:complete len:591 (+) Transcript_21420:124-1896(+)|eukprot:CAMPEP_0202463428 /NCGR_PEP_ID=MMETSP1360-20130828/58137_1 /ASSEMBLY_ACC=CAM_ASM_000848 /TAXON_ID=515479 /ORGANISM="Licmophora paradoxa, Strain CCMP2313" /LENGTH=590 /DNA_ID=CAMNT_0049086339 /DNA_START=101 /DNA_END=1873 /DNA_ORIENTATION=+